MPQPQNRRSARTRDALLEAAWQLLSTDGSAAATITAVAAAAGVSRRAFYLHFDSRAQLLVALVEYVDRELDLEASTAGFWAAPDGPTMLDEGIRHVCRYHSRIRPLLVAIDQARETDSDAAAMWDEATGNWKRGARLVTDRLEAEGALAEPWTPATAAEAIFAYNVAFNDLWRVLVGEQEWTEQQLSDFMVATHRTTFLTPEAQRSLPPVAGETVT